MRAAASARSAGVGDIQPRKSRDPAMNRLLVLTILYMLISPSSAPADEPAGTWLQFRGDRALTGRSALKGNIRNPAVVWKQFVGARETLLAVRCSAEGASTVRLPSDDADADKWSAALARWNVGPALADLDGDGKARELAASPQHRIGKFLDDRPGLQKLEFDSLFGTSGDHPPPAAGRLLARSGGGWERVWASDPMPWLFTANPITGDFDHDGRLDVAATPWYDLWIFDLATGKFKAKARYTPEGAESGRAYGWLGAADFDGDGKQEFVVLGDFENFMTVLGWKDGKLAPLWSRLIERGITMKKTIVRTGVLPVQDIDGDGRPEIVLSLFTATGDGRWHTLALDGMTGRTRLDLPDQVLSGVPDLDGDGAADLACTATRGALIPDRSTLTIHGFKDSQHVMRWREEDAAFQIQPLSELPAGVNTNASTGTTTLLTVPAKRKGRPFFHTRRTLDRAAARVELTVWRADEQGRIKSQGRLIGPRLEVLAGRVSKAETGEVEFLVRARDTGDEAERVSLTTLAGAVLASRREGVPLATPVVGRLAPGERPTVVVQGACEQIASFQPGPLGTQSKVLARQAGRGLYTGSGRFGGGTGFGGVVLADLLGDGALETIAATSAPDGHAQLVAYGPKHQLLWKHDFDDLPGASPEWNIGGLTLWFAGRFTDPRRCDVLVNIRRGTMHSDETFLLDGRTGEVVWRRAQGGNSAGNQRACGGSWFAIYDHDGNGLDDALLLYPDLVSVLDGRTGKLSLDRHTNHGVFKDTWTLYAVPSVVDVLHRGRPQIVYGCNSTVFALLAADGSPVWRHGPSPGWPDVLPGIGDFDGDGDLELLSVGHRPASGAGGHEARCYNAATGSLEWTVEFTRKTGFMDMGSYMAPATGDIDGDGRDEAVLAIGKTLAAVGASPNGKTGVVRWTLAFPDQLGPPAIADALGQGAAEIVVVCADGNVYGVGDGRDRH